jgi:hypothetical protein
MRERTALVWNVNTQKPQRLPVKFRSQSGGPTANAKPPGAMVYWGIAMSLWNELGDYPDQGSIEKAKQAISKAHDLKLRTEREADYVAAIELFYRKAEAVDGQTAAVAYSDAMAKIHERYPEDREGPHFTRCLC